MARLIAARINNKAYSRRHLRLVRGRRTNTKDTMKISQLIDLLTEQLMENPDDEIMIYNSSGELIEPKSFSFGGMSTDKGFIDTVSFSDLE